MAIDCLISTPCANNTLFVCLFVCLFVYLFVFFIIN